MKELDKIGDTFEASQFQKTYKGICISTIVISIDIAKKTIKEIEHNLKFYHIISFSKNIICLGDSAIIKTTRIVLTEKILNKISEKEAYKSYYEMKKQVAINSQTSEFVQYPKLFDWNSIEQFNSRHSKYSYNNNNPTLT